MTAEKIDFELVSTFLALVATFNVSRTDKNSANIGKLTGALHMKRAFKGEGYR